MGHDLPYRESSLTCSYNQVLRNLRDVGPVRVRAALFTRRNRDHSRHHLAHSGILAQISILWTIGIILVVIGVILAILGATGHAIAGRRHFF